MKKFLYAPLSVCAFLGLSLPAFATNGYFSEGFGTANKSMAGAGVAFPTDAMGTAINPALMAHVGNQITLGVNLFMPDRGFTANTPSSTPAGVPFISPGTYESSNDFFLIPYFGWNKMLDDNRSIGISVGGNGGMNTQYDSAVFGNFAAPGFTSSPTGVDMAQLFVGFNYAQKLDDHNTLGVAPILAVQRIEVTGLQPFTGVSASPDNVTNRGYDYSYGAGIKLGWYGPVNDWLSLGASIQSKTYMTRFDKYRGLLAESGSFDIPPILQAGVAVKPTPAITVAFDVQDLMFSNVKSIHNPNNVQLVPGNIYMGTDNGLGFGWDDMIVYKIGAQWTPTSEWAFRAGYSKGNEVIPGQQGLFNIIAPATVTDHISLGAGWSFDAKNTINLAYIHAFDKSINGSSPNTPFQTGSLEMSQNSVELGWTYKF
ncbi:MAG: outer membrane protein transport protein [Magnetococcales bacterium]|nr:outer membrane protein transport protein [Magnetococcales bacterium]